MVKKDGNFVLRFRESGMGLYLLKGSSCAKAISLKNEHSNGIGEGFTYKIWVLIVVSLLKHTFFKQKKDTD